jgi:putative ABC transport system ATP-binding protein
MYELRGVTKRYKRGKESVDALDGVDLTIGDGDRLVIQGPTGGGKSTLLQMLGGLDRPTAGSVELDGTDLARLSESKLTKVRSENIGFVFQSFNLIPTLTAQENVETALVPLKLKVKDRRERAAAALDSVGLAERLGHLPAELSGGQQQRVAIARALVKQPKVLLETMWKEHGLTFIMVTHDSAIAKKAPRLATIRKGKITVKENANS